MQLKILFFSIKEVDVGIVADVGTMARMGKIIGNHSLYRELCFSGRNFNASEALQLGLISRIFKNQQEMKEETLKIAIDIASKSPIAVCGIKEMANYAFDHSVQECQNHVALWNSIMLQAKDPMEAASANLQKKKPNFSKL